MSHGKIDKQGVSSPEGQPTKGDKKAMVNPLGSGKVNHACFLAFLYYVFISAVYFRDVGNSENNLFKISFDALKSVPVYSGQLLSFYSWVIYFISKYSILRGLDMIVDYT